MRVGRGEYVEWLRLKIHDLQVPSSTRNRAALASFAIVQSHHHAIVVLCEHGLFASAFALLRSCFESYVRGQWLLNCASQQQLDAFLAGKNPPGLTDLISAVEEVQGLEEQVLSQLKQNHWHSLCAYTHSGSLHLQRWQSDEAVEPNYDPEEIEEVLVLSEILGSIAVVATLCVADQLQSANEVVETLRGRGRSA